MKLFSFSTFETTMKEKTSQHPLGDGTVSYIPFSFLSPPASSLHQSPSPYPPSNEENALNQTAVTSLRLLPPIVVQFIVIGCRM